MWKSYLLTALRSLARQRLFSAINILGLALGMAACLAMALWVGTESRYERWVPQSDRVFVVMSRTQYPGQAEQLWRHAPAPMLPAMQADHSDLVQATSRYMPAQRAVRVGERLANQTMALVDAGFFEVLPWPVAEGSTEGAFKQPGKLVVTPSFVRKWFADGKALGQTVTITVKGQPRPFEIVAVLAPLPAASIFDFEALALLDAQDLPDPSLLQNWGSFSTLSLLRVKAAGDEAMIQLAADAFVERHIEPFVKVDNGFFWRPLTVPITQAHLKPVQVGGPGKPPGDATLVWAVAATAGLVLLIATVTYVNLVTARASLRAREVGLRKTLGASRSQLMAQFLVESTVLAATAALLALALLELALPAFNALLGQQVRLRYLGPEGALWPLAVMVLAVGLLGGWYPALVLARLQPGAALHAQLGGRGGLVRQALVVLQFAVAATLMACLAVIQAQVQHLRKLDMGYEPEGLVVIGNLQRSEVKAIQAPLLEAMKRVPGVVAGTRSTFDPTSQGVMRQPARLAGVPDEKSPQVSVQPVDWDYARTYGLRLLAGRDLERDNAADDVNALGEEKMLRDGFRVLINRAALTFFHTTDPAEAVGKTFHIGNAQQRITMTVVGVVENLRLRSAKDAPEPSFFARDIETASSMTLRFAGVPSAQMIERLQSAWQAQLPNTPFSAKLVDEAVAGYYAAEQRTGRLFALFAGLAIALCAMGLYGLAVFSAQRRTREIGLRKVMGARVSDIVRLLLWQFSRPVLWALLLALPLAWVLMRVWLNGFDARIALTPWPFLAAGALALAVALATVAGHAWKVARTNPALALQHE
jgi:putative ABC transport system permease protein